MIENYQGQQCQTYYVFLKGLYVSHVHSCVRLYDIRVNRSIQYFPKPLHWIILLQEMCVRSTVDNLRGLVSSLRREALAASSLLLSEYGGGNHYILLKKYLYIYHYFIYCCLVQINTAAL